MTPEEFDVFAPQDENAEKLLELIAGRVVEVPSKLKSMRFQKVINDYKRGYNIMVVYAVISLDASRDTSVLTTSA